MDRCNLCGGTQFTVVEDHGAVQVVRCACQLVFVTPVPSRDAIEETYQDDYYEYRHVLLPKALFKKMPRTKLLTEMEWRQLG